MDNAMILRNYSKYNLKIDYLNVAEKGTSFYIIYCSL